MERQFYLGCAVWAHKDWAGELFPPGSKNAEYLRLYSHRLTTVEGNTTFYATPNVETVRRWASETPENFRFCFKIPQEISHTGLLSAGVAATHTFVERMAGLGERLGPFFLQLPPGYRADKINDLETWLANWPADRRLTIEVRHAEWYAPQNEMALMELLNRYQAGRVLMDVRPLQCGPLPGAEQDLQRARDNKPDVPLHPIHSGNIALIRYIGHPDLPLNDPLLDEWAGRVAAWLAEGVQVYFFMHCPIERYSPALCRAFQKRLAGVPGVLPLPWDELDSGLQQATLF